jgi:hypothetical protein
MREHAHRKTGKNEAGNKRQTKGRNDTYAHNTPTAWFLFLVPFNSLQLMGLLLIFRPSRLAVVVRHAQIIHHPPVLHCAWDPPSVAAAATSSSSSSSSSWPGLTHRQRLLHPIPRPVLQRHNLRSLLLLLFMFSPETRAIDQQDARARGAWGVIDQGLAVGIDRLPARVAERVYGEQWGLRALGPHGQLAQGGEACERRKGKKQESRDFKRLPLTPSQSSSSQHVLTFLFEKNKTKNKGTHRRQPPPGWRALPPPGDRRRT